MKTIAPSILACDFLHLEDEIKKIEKSGSQYVHIDVMDGCFVPNISFGMPIIKAVRKCTNLMLDVHLMIANPEIYIEEFKKCGADILTFHLETMKDKEAVTDMIHYVKNAGMKVGISIKPKTPAKSVFPFVSLVDMVLVMTVEPGFGGQSFMADMVPKVKEIREFANSINKRLDIEVDGGIDAKTIEAVKTAGANVFVMGTAFFKAEDTSKIASLLD